MSINMYDKLIDTIYLGNNQIIRIYQGNSEIYNSIDVVDENVAYSIAMISDPHFSYSNYTDNNIRNQINKFTNLVSCMNAASHNKLDAVWSCGDYTSTGCYYQGVTAMSAIKATTDELARINSKPIAFEQCFGNHDISWGGNMPISGTNNYSELNNNQTWKSVADAYGFNFNVESNMTVPTLTRDGTGWYRVTGNVFKDIYTGTIKNNSSSKLILNNVNLPIAIGTKAYDGSNLYETTDESIEVRISINGNHSSAAAVTKKINPDTISSLSSFGGKIDTLSTYNFIFNNLEIPANTTYNMNIQVKANNSVVTMGTTKAAVATSVDYTTLSYFYDVNDRSYVSSFNDKNGKKYNVISLTADSFTGNDRYNDLTLNWLDYQLNKIKVEDPNSYIFVLSHMPIAKTKTWGTNEEFNKTANWASYGSDKLFDILSKYPQVIYFSGHTHFVPYLETNITQTAFTAVNCGSLNSSLFGKAAGSTNSGYDFDSNQEISGQNPIGLLIQIMNDGSIQIKRISSRGITYNNSVDGSSSTSNNPAKTTTNDEPEVINYIDVNSVSMQKGTRYGIYGDTWMLPAIVDANVDLSTYKIMNIRANSTIEVNNNSPVSSYVDMVGNGDGTGLVHVAIAVPKSSENIVCYKLNIRRVSDGAIIHNPWFIGNWCEITSGVAGGGNSHKDTNYLEYNFNVDTYDSSYIFELYAYNEYGKELLLYNKY